MKSYNDTHPELRPGEVFLTNVQEHEWQTIRLMSKRRGSQAYDRTGTPLPADQEAFPVFVLEKELHIYHPPGHA